MNATHQYHIIKLFVFLDDRLGRQAYVTGRRPLLSNAEILTILIWSALTENHQRLSEVYGWVKRVYPGWFVLPAYKNFVISCHRALPAMAALLKVLLAEHSPCASPIQLCCLFAEESELKDIGQPRRRPNGAKTGRAGTSASSCMSALIT